MKRFVFTSSILIISSLFSQNYKASQKTLTQSHDELEILVNELLSEKRTPVHHQQTQEYNFKSEKFFIQMFVYSEKKPASLIRKIRQKGYSTTSKTVRRNNQHVNLLLVGPYESRAEVEHYLSDLRSISKGAFIYHSTH